MAGYWASYLSGMGLSVGMLFLLFLIMVWDLVWKLMAMWKASKKHSVVWFVVLSIINTAGILPMLYLYVFSKMKFHKKEEEKPKRRRVKKVRRKRR